MLENDLSSALVYDVEIYKNIFVVTFYSFRTNTYRVFKWYKNHCDIPQLINLVTNKSDPRTLVSYNGLNFDDGVLNHIINEFNNNLTILELWEFSQKLIGREGGNPYRYKSPFKSIDCMEILRVGRSSKSLKLVATNLKFPRIQDLPIPYDEEIKDEQVDELISYNKNDVDITITLFNYLNKQGELEMRDILSKQYNLSLHTSAESRMAKDLFNKFYYEKVLEKDSNIDVKELSKLRTERKEIPLNTIILPKISFKTEELQNFHKSLLDLSIINVGFDNEDGKSKFVCDIPELKFDGIEYSVALGGIHSVDDAAIIEEDEEHLLLDLD